MIVPPAECRRKSFLARRFALRYSVCMKTPTPALATPSPGTVRKHLLRLKLFQLKALSRASKVPYTTLFNIRSGDTLDPRVSTVRAIEPHYAKAQSLPKL